MLLFQYRLSSIQGKIFVIDFICRSDPTENDSVEGLRPNARGPGLVTFGVCHAFFLIEFTCQLEN